MTFKIIETFSGIGSQAKAFAKIKKKNPSFDYRIEATVEWEIGALYAYDLIHHGPQNLTKYDNLSKCDLLELLGQYNLSSDGKQPLKPGALNRMSIDKLKSIWHSIEKSNNLVDISKVHASDFPPADLLTYSFPCQDLSISSFWHSNFDGINKGTQSRSGLLWEIERILKEYEETNKPMPRYLLMENVSAIQSPLHNTNFVIWQEELERMGYINIINNFKAFNFGIPQTRVRTFMISIYVDDLDQGQIADVKHHFEASKLNQESTKPPIDAFLRLDYSDSRYYQEALVSTPNYTPSRKRIGADSVLLARGQKPTNNIAKTITTKQDRYPNAGIIIHEHDFGEGKSPYRNLTPRETFLLMGFDEEDFQLLIDNNLKVTKSRRMLSNAKLLKLSGNSIVVNILEAIFSEILIVNNTIIHNYSNVSVG